MTSYHAELKSGPKGRAAPHAKYIARMGKHESRGDLIDSGYGNLPAWSDNDPYAFWNGSDKHERANGAAYREWIVAIPNEFNLHQTKAFAKEAIKKIVGDKPFQYATHASPATLGEVQNTHLHIMYSDRLPDGIHRSPEQTFSRYNSKHPDLGGCKKDSGGKNRMEVRDDVMAKREVFADIQNQMLIESGSKARVDHRSHRARGIERKPERHLGPARINRMSAADRADYVSSRSDA